MISLGIKYFDPKVAVGNAKLPHTRSCSSWGGHEQGAVSCATFVIQNLEKSNVNSMVHALECASLKIRDAKNLRNSCDDSILYNVPPLIILTLMQITSLLPNTKSRFQRLIKITWMFLVAKTSCTQKLAERLVPMRKAQQNDKHLCLVGDWLLPVVRYSFPGSIGG